MTQLIVKDHVLPTELKIHSYDEDFDLVLLTISNVSDNNTNEGFENFVEIAIQDLPTIITYLQKQYDAYCLNKD